MARTTRTVQIAALNIAMHAPHSAQRYIDMMRVLFRRRYVARLGKVFAAMVGSLYPLDSDRPDKGLSGEIYRFLKLDPNEPWFNMATKEAASDDDVQQIVIPRHLLPHLQRIPFVFHARTHRLYFVARDRTDSLGPGTAKRMFEQFAERLMTHHDFPHIEVTVIPDHETLERILSMPTLQTLQIALVRPNADDGDAEEQRWLKKLADQKSRKITVELTSERDTSIAPDEDTRSMARAAALNGHVSASGRDAGGARVQESTIDKPLLTPAHVNTELETLANVLTRTAEEMDAQQ